MNKYLIGFSILMSSVLSGCEDKKGDKSPSDSIKKDTVIKTDTVVEVKEPELTGKAALIAKTWKAVVYKTPDREIKGDLIELLDIRYNLKKDFSLEYSEGEKKENGKWSIDTSSMKLTFEYTGEPKAEYEIQELTEEKLKISGKEHGIKRTFELAPVK
jgi:hypothetical protein